MDPLKQLSDQLTCHACSVSPSACDDYFSCPRRFLYQKRLRLFPRYIRVSLAKSLGSYFHLFMQRGPERVQEVEQLHQQTALEIASKIEEEGDLDGRLAKDLNDDAQAYDLAHVMAEVLWLRYPLPPISKVLARELKLEAEVDGIYYKGIIDLLICHCEPLLWVADYKTTSFDASVAAAGYSYSFAYWIYRLLTQQYIGESVDAFGQEKPILDGIQLTCIQRPGIKWCDRDRDYTVERLEKKSGPNKGEWYDKKTYHGEPVWDNYVQRCLQWYKDQEIEPVVQLSRRYPHCDALMPPDIKLQIMRVARACACPEPLASDFDMHFPRRRRSCADPYGHLCDYNLLCSSAYTMWDGVIQQDFEYKPPDLEPKPKGDPTHVD